MAFEATLNIDGNPYNINWMMLEVGRKEDQRGKPASRPSWGLVVCLDVMDDKTIKNWMIDPHMQKDGKIILSRIDESATFKEIEFKQSVCVNYSDIFMADMNYMNTRILITGGELVINKATLRVT
ncbi:type VI secretion system tube protein TssD [Spirosoma panaciterrae]|uniref:type VI secretion system tube protein TssD n=1 Tax=Spirosoma panaciterrae TaxID=496058 RepID=UPI0003753778|nr:type VI secretion system tube protein TssD [Spirosoma panaciterrae]